jgi:ABC-type enterochelin transport system permease subunit
MEQVFKMTKSFLGQVTEIGFLLIALGVVAGILTGGSVPFMGDVVGNITAFVKTLGDNGANP